MAKSVDGIYLEKYKNNPIIAKAPESGQDNDFRDPKVWEKGGTWYMVIGTAKDERGKVVLYRSGDLIHWEYSGVMTESDGSMGRMWECPDLFELGGKDVLIFSPMGIGTKEKPNISGYVIGNLNYETAAYKHGSFVKLDEGFDFYAPQTTHDDKGRRIMFGWLVMSENAPQDSKWAGAMSLPRMLEYGGENKILSKPIPELKDIRANHIYVDHLNIDSEVKSVKGIHGDSLEIIAAYDLTNCGAKAFGVNLRCSEDKKEKTIIKYDVNRKAVIFNRSAASAEKSKIKMEADISTCEIKQSEGNKLLLHLFIDRSVIEVFINDGEYVMSGFVFPRTTSLGVEFFAVDGSITIDKIDAWTLVV